MNLVGEVELPPTQDDMTHNINQSSVNTWKILQISSSLKWVSLPNTDSYDRAGIKLDGIQVANEIFSTET